ncbi:MAG: GtrA family protein [Paracoccaceae bacterium]
MLGQIIRFGLVGGLATLVHMLVGVSLIGTGMAPLLANLCAFLVAFGVSFIGHYGFSFPQKTASLSSAFKRFILVAIGGFLINESLLALYVWAAIGPAALGLILSTGFAAAATFFASRNWAFRAK